MDSTYIISKIYLLNIEILIFFRLNIYKGGLYEYNDPSNNGLSIFTGQQYKVIPLDITQKKKRSPEHSYKEMHQESAS